jgi:hypothetical protein
MALNRISAWLCGHGGPIKPKTLESKFAVQWYSNVKLWQQ